MPHDLNSGFGLCKMEATTKVVAPQSWIAEGRELDFAATVLAAVHAHNRHAAEGEFIALDFPAAVFRREFGGKPGTRARLVGSRKALTEILDSHRLKQFRRRVVHKGRDLISDFTPRSEGYCVVRSQKSEKLQPGDIRRRLKRAKARGHAAHNIAYLEKRLEEALSMSIEERRIKGRAPREAAIFLGDKPFFFTREKVKASGATAMVSTYGMSSVKSPMIFDAWVEDGQAKISEEDAELASILAGIVD